MSLVEVRHALLSRSSKGVRTTFSRKYFPHKGIKARYISQRNNNNNLKDNSSLSELLSPTLQSFSTFVVADQMTPLGCRCNVLLLSREERTNNNNNEHESTDNISSSNADLNSVRQVILSSQSYSTKTNNAFYSAKTIITLHAKQKVTLPELAPRDIVHIKGNYLDSIVHNKCLPENVINSKRVYRKRTAHQYSNVRAKNLIENNKLTDDHCNDYDDCSFGEDVMSESTAVHKNSLFTRLHEYQDCPWSALSTSLSSAVKQKILKRYVENVIQNCKVSPTMDDNNSKDEEKNIQVKYYEPLSIQVLPNRLQEINFVFVHECIDTDNANNKEAQPNKTKQTGYFVLASCTNLNSDTFTDDNNYKQTQSHPLLTLEQKRLLVALNTWVADVPFLIQATLHSVNIHQPSHVPSKKPWEASLIVTLCVAKPHENSINYYKSNTNHKRSNTRIYGNNYVFDDDSNVDGNPLYNNTNHSNISYSSCSYNDVLSAEEQRLLHFILNATPLIKHVELHLLNLSTLHWEKLHPTIIRSSLSTSNHSVNSINNASSFTNYFPEIINDTQHRFLSQKSNKEVEFDHRTIMKNGLKTVYPLSSIEVNCMWCAKPFVEYIPALSSTLWRYVLDANTKEQVQCNRLNLEYKGKEVLYTYDIERYVYTLPFWRHYQSLSETCSLLLSLALEPFAPIPSFSTKESNVSGYTLKCEEKELIKHVLLYSGHAKSLQVVRKYRYSAKIADPIAGHAKLFDTLRQILNTLAKTNKETLKLRVISKDDNAKQNMHKECANDLTAKSLSSEEQELICICCLSNDDEDDHNVLTTLLTACTNCCNTEQRIRLVLVECSVDLRLTLLRDALVKTLLTCTESANKGSKLKVCIALNNLQSGIVNVDPLSSSMIGYCTCDLIIRQNTQEEPKECPRV